MRWYQISRYSFDTWIFHPFPRNMIQNTIFVIWVADINDLCHEASDLPSFYYTNVTMNCFVQLRDTGCSLSLLEIYLLPIPTTLELFITLTASVNAQSSASSDIKASDFINSKHKKDPHLRSSPTHQPQPSTLQQTWSNNRGYSAPPDLWRRRPMTRICFRS